MDLRALNYFVAVAQERHFGRAAVRLHMTQPPLSRAIKRLEEDLGTVLLLRSAAGVTLTAAGAVLYEEARTLLEQADQLRTRVLGVAGAATVTVGVLADSGEQAGHRLAAAFRERHPHVRISIREADFTDPTAGLRAGLVDVALTRAPFDDTGISSQVLRSDPIGVVLRTDDSLAVRAALDLADLDEHRWFQLPDGTDPVWRAYWNGDTLIGGRRYGPVVHTVQECLQAVLWDDTIGLTRVGAAPARVATLDHALPDGLTSIPLTDMPPSRLEHHQPRPAYRLLRPPCGNPSRQHSPHPPGTDPSEPGRPTPRPEPRAEPRRSASPTVGSVGGRQKLFATDRHHQPGAVTMSDTPRNPLEALSRSQQQTVVVGGRAGVRASG